MVVLEELAGEDEQAGHRPLLLHAGPGGRLRPLRARPGGAGPARLRLLRSAHRPRRPRMPADELTPGLDGTARARPAALGRGRGAGADAVELERHPAGRGRATAPGCLRAVYKPRRGERPLWDFPAGLDRREVAAYELSAWLGWDIVPETVLRDDDGLPFGVGSLQRFVPFDVEAALLHAAGGRRRATTPCAPSAASTCWPTAPTARAGTAWPATTAGVWAVDNGLTSTASPSCAR